jgi:2'-5' RNA ligase
MRLFVAIAIDQRTADQIEAWCDSLKPAAPQLRWQPRESWHITLKFLGATPPERLAQVIEALRPIAPPAFEVQVGGFGFFSRAGVFFTSVVLSPKLQALAAAIDRAMNGCGYKLEAIEYHPHVTLGRTRVPAAIRRLEQALARGPQPPFHAFRATEYQLYESFTRPEGSRYEIRERFPLDQ